MSGVSPAGGRVNLPVLYRGGRPASPQPIAPVVRVEALYEHDEAPQDPEDKPHLRGLLLDMVI